MFFEYFKANKKSFFIVVVAIIAVPLIIYFYFLKWRTQVIYGDDLYIFKEWQHLNGVAEKINMPVISEKYRPVNGLFLYFINDWFKKNVEYYYFFNVAIQAINTIIFAALLNLFLRSIIFSFLFSLLLGISRFSFFNITQLMNGGALEGLAITFFLLSLYFVIRAMKSDTQNSSAFQSNILWSILFANLSMYTHERYIAMLIFIVGVIILFPGFRPFPAKIKRILLLISVASIVLNIFIKKVLLNIPFFVGTAGTNIEFSFSSAYGFLIDGILSIFGVNSGPAYLTGIPYKDISGTDKFIVWLLLIGFLTSLLLFVLRVKKGFRTKDKPILLSTSIFIALISLFFLFLVPAVLTIRIEQRWLQASFAIFILLNVIAMKNIDFGKNTNRFFIYSVFILLFAWVDYTYLDKGGNNIYIKSAERIVSNFKKAVDNNVIRITTNKLYVWENPRNINAENDIKWSLADGYFFDFYQYAAKDLVFTDSVYSATDTSSISAFRYFDEDKGQIIYFGNHILDITRYYLKDSLNSISTIISQPEIKFNKMQYNQKKLLITLDDFDKVSASGFYNKESTFRWASNNASIRLLGDFVSSDSLTVNLQTYMPPPCKDVFPRLKLIDYVGREYQPFKTERVIDKFTYRFVFKKRVVIDQIEISSAIINSGKDIRVLSFPFISLELVQ